MIPQLNPASPSYFAVLYSVGVGPDRFRQWNIALTRRRMEEARVDLREAVRAGDHRWAAIYRDRIALLGNALNGGVADLRHEFHQEDA